MFFKNSFEPLRVMRRLGHILLPCEPRIAGKRRERWSVSKLARLKKQPLRIPCWSVAILQNLRVYMALGPTQEALKNSHRPTPYTPSESPTLTPTPVQHAGGGAAKNKEAAVLRSKHTGQQELNILHVGLTNVISYTRYSVRVD